MTIDRANGRYSKTIESIGSASETGAINWFATHKPMAIRQQSHCNSLKKLTRNSRELSSNSNPFSGKWKGLEILAVSYLSHSRWDKLPGMTRYPSGYRHIKLSSRVRKANSLRGYHDALFFIGYWYARRCGTSFLKKVKDNINYNNKCYDMIDYLRRISFKKPDYPQPS